MSYLASLLAFVPGGLRALASVALILLAAPILLAAMGAASTEPPNMRVLVFTKTAGFRHESITAGVTAIRELGMEFGFRVHRSEDATIFNEAGLEPYHVVVFLNTTGTIFDDEQRRAFERFIQRGGGFVGVHSASDTEYDWPWYGRLVGAYFSSHPQVQDAVVRVTNRDHRSTRHLPAEWERRDEWYNFQTAPEHVKVLATLDNESFDGGKMGEHHPIAWYHRYDGGRAWYTAGGHTPESFHEPLFREHLLGGILWAAGE